jgi:amino acid adenylation domain-containing protein/non-ribosomal peptide synthase protein (TIGR01720 family)
MRDSFTGQEVAIVGMSGRFPGARTVEEFWRNLRGGVDSITRFSEEELLAAGVRPDLVRNPDYVRANGLLRDVELFDAAFFGLSPRDAVYLNPTQRLFLECAWEALEQAGYDPAAYAGRVGVFSGAELNGYWKLVARHPKLRGAELPIHLGNAPGSVPTRTSFLLGLEGPSLNVQTACSSSLVAIHLAYQSVLSGESDMALAGGVSIEVPQVKGYLYEKGGIASPTGQCRSFDADARGAVRGSGVGIVLLKRLADALEDGDTIHAMVLGTAVNNDGSGKIGFTAPRRDGQARAIGEALAMAGVEPDSISYVEGHGSATELGDPIEVEALTQAFRERTDRTGFCALGSVKSNVGHLDSAAGIAGLIKTVLSLEHGEIPPSLYFERPSPRIDFERSPFFVNAELRPWPRGGAPRRAGVSSFGMGGTNAHVVLEEAPQAEPSGPSRPLQLLVLSARTPAALEEATDRLALHLRENPEQPLADVAHTLRVGRRRFTHRRVLVCGGREEAAAALEARDPARIRGAAAEWDGREVVFLFPGLGDHYGQMARGLYEAEPVFREEVDRCAEILREQLGRDIREVLFPGDAPAEQRPGAGAAGAGTDLRRMLGRGGGDAADGELARTELARTELAHPAVFVVEYALARLWMAWGIAPAAMLGHSLGEYVAATLAGVFELPDALALVAERARLVAELPEGAMLAVPMDPAGVEPLLRGGIALAAHNAPGLCTLSGPPEAVAALEAELLERGVACRRLAASHPFHSPLMEPVAERLAARVRRVPLRAPALPFLSNVTGTWITAAEATDPAYWTRHLCRTVRFAECLAELLADPGRLLLEVGPGRTLGTFALAAGAAEPSVLASLRHAYTRQPDQAFLLETLGRSWLAGARPDWRAFAAGERRRRVPLPTYPWERQRFWVDAPPRGGRKRRAGPRRAEGGPLLLAPAWRQGPLPEPAGEPRTWALLVDERGIGARVAEALRAAGHRVVVVEPGAAFERAGPEAWRLRPERGEDYTALHEALRREGTAPAEWVHLWSLGGSGDDGVEGIHRRGYASLLHLARAVEGGRIQVVTDRVLDATGVDAVEPARAMLLGALETIPREYPGLACRLVDVVPGGDEARLVEALGAELRGGSEPEAALRGWRRWTRRWTRPEEAVRDAPVRADGFYLLGGRLGPRALAAAGQLAARGAGLLLLEGETFPGEREGWDRWLAAHDRHDSMSRTIRAVREMEARGIRVLARGLDAQDPARVAEALAEARARFGALRGVVHTVEVGRTRESVPLRTLAPGPEAGDFRAALAEMEALERVLGEERTDFCLLQCALPASPVGSLRLHQAAAAEVAAAFARRHGAEHRTRWTAVRWDLAHELDDPGADPAAAEGWAPVLARVLAADAGPQLRVGPRRPARAASAGQDADVTLLYSRPALATPYAAPATDTERRVAETWQDTLGIGRVGVHDDFFSLGGHSLFATQIISRLRDAFRVELSLSTLFGSPTVAGLAAAVEELRRTAPEAEADPIVPVPHDRPLPLSFQQQRMWLLDQIEPGTPFYNVAVSYRFRGPLQLEPARRALGMVVERHSVLRTVYRAGDGSEPVQVILPDVDLPLPVDDLRHLAGEAERETGARRLAVVEAERPFDLAREPSIRARLLRLADEDWVLLTSTHHIATDGWSGTIFFEEWIRCYAAVLAGEAPRLPELPVQYADFAVWQRRWLSGERLAGQVEYWRERLEGAPLALELPTDRVRPPVRSYRGANHRVFISPELKARLEALCAGEGVTLFTLLIAAYKVLLLRHSGQEDLVVGTVDANRARPEIEPLMGFFINTLPIRTRLDGDPTVPELLGRVRDAALGAYAHAELPLEKLLEELRLERDLSRNPLIQVMFGFERPIAHFADAAPQVGLRAVDYDEKGLTDSGTAKFDLDVLLREYPEEGTIGGIVGYNLDLFDPSTAERLLAGYVALLEAIAEAPGRRISELEVMSPGERERVLVEFNATGRPFPRAPLAHELFAATARRLPDAPAVLAGGETVRYRELEERSARLAAALRRRGVGPETPVGVYLERGPELLVALLGILGAGGAFVPLDPSHPADRVGHVLRDAAVPLVVTEEALRDRLPAHPAELLLLDGDPADGKGAEPPPAELHPGNLAYVIYTSGSTGTPKGVRVEHRSLLDTLLGARERFGVREGDVMPSLASPAFDIWLFETLLPLVSGGAVRMVPAEHVTDMDALLRDAADATLLHAVPALMRQMVAALPPGGTLPRVRRAFVGGDAVAPDLLAEMRNAFPAAETHVLYGPTEGSVICTSHLAGEDGPERQLLGSPLPNARVYVCDEPGRALPIGVPGELLLGGPGVARGYHGRPDLTAERFVPDPFGAAPGERLYRTGDRARWRPEGTLEFMGRTDEQVKVRGYRVEPGEVEAALLRHEGVAEAVVVLRDGRLVGYYTARGPLGAAELKARLRASLPEYMVPSALVELEAFPLTPTGKTDRAALPAPERAGAEAGHVAPRTPVEEALAAAWRSVLRVERVGVHDNFFELGGDSILSIQAVSRARRAGVELKPRHFFEHPTIAELARLAATVRAVSAEQGPVTGEAPLTPIQHAFFALGLPEPWHFNMPLLLRGRGPLDHAALEGAVRALAEHHDALRASFTRGEDGRWIQRFAAPEPELPVERVDLSGVPEAERAAVLERLAGERQGELRFEGPLLRATHFDFGTEAPGRVLLLAHHLVVDGASWRTLVEDLETAYGQRVRGEPVALPPKTTSFRAWAERLAEHARTGGAAAELAFWTDPARAGAPPLPTDFGGPDGEDTEAVVAAALTAEETRTLLQAAPAAYRTRADDLLLAALALALGRWTGDGRVLVDVESHGREELFADVDLSRTVGWFTAVHPLFLDLRGADGEEAAIKTVKEAIRAVPDRGIGWGLLRRLGPDPAREALAARPAAQVAFNYLGQVDGTFADAGAFLAADEGIGRSRSPRGERAYLLDVMAVVEGGRLQLRIGYGTGRHRPETVERLAADVLAGIRALAAHCAAPEAGGHTPSDFPLAPMTQAELDELLGRERGIEDVYPATPMQEGMLFHTLFAPEGGAYVGQFMYDLEGDVDAAAFRRAWSAAAQRHAVLRTAFHWGGERPFQVVRREAEAPTRVEDWSALDAADREARLAAFLAEDRAAGFDPARAPLMRLALFCTGERTHRLVWTHHHALLDGWSLPLVFRDVARFYDAFRAGREPAVAPGRPYRDYVAWLQRQDTAAAEAFWREQLAGVEGPTPLGIDRAASGPETGFGRVDARLPAELSGRLAELARGAGLTLGTLLQGAWALLLSRYSGEHDVVFGATVSGRAAEVDGVEEMVGLFINTLPVRVAVPADVPALPWLRRLQDAQARVREWEHAPLAQVQRWSGVEGAPLFESILVWENYPVEEALAATPQRDFELRTVGGIEQTDYPLTLVAAPLGAERAVGLSASYARARFDPDAMERMLGHFGAVLAAFARAPEARLGEVELIAGAERERVLAEWSGTDHGLPAGTVHELLAAQAARTPDAPAVSFGGQALGYGELDRRANRLANHLRALGVGPETRVGVCLERTPELVVALVAVLKAGGAYVPLDPAYPADRLAYMVADSGAAVVLAQESVAGRLPLEGTRVVDLDAEREAVAARPETAPESGAGPENLAYVIYTSGSTGRPKGAMVRHSSVVVLLHWLREAMTDEERSAALFSTSVSFDVSVAELFGTLAWGGKLVMVENALELAGLAEPVVTAGMVPTAAAELLRGGGIPAGVKTLNLCGEAIPPDLARAIHALGTVATLNNLYGPTEDTVFSTSWRVQPGADRILVGRPVAGTRAYVLDGELRPVPPGVPGETYLAGAGLARGYLGRPELTAERFVPDPFGPAGGRMYRVMDRARWTPAGELEYLGRTDFQLKVRGFRVEPGEVEAMLRTHPGVREAVVVVRGDAPGGPHLVAYVVADGGDGAPAGELRAWLRERLPEHMVPSAFVALERIPLTPNGKTDRRALPAPEGGAGPAAYAPPRTSAEELLAEIMADVLGLERVGVHDNFFDIGGHSLVATRVVARIRRELGIQLPLRALFDAPTVAELAGRLDAERPAAPAAAMRMDVMLEQLEALSDEEVMRLLAEEDAP